MMFGQDRYRRRYWILPQCGGIFVEGMESGEGKSHKGMVTHKAKTCCPSPEALALCSKVFTFNQMLNRLLSIDLSTHVVLWYLFLVRKEQVIPFKMRIGILEVFSCCTSTCYAFSYLPTCKVFLTLSELFHLSLWQWPLCMKIRRTIECRKKISSSVVTFSANAQTILCMKLR